MTDSAIDADTIAAYQNTDFCIDDEPAFVMHIGQACGALQKLYAERACTSCAFITACNPFGQSASDALNEARQARFADLLAARGLSYLSGAGRDPNGCHPPEASFLVLGLTLQEAMAIGRELNQNAIVWCGADRIAQLVLLR